VDFTINVNADCVPCSINEIQVSKTITANGDGINDLFVISGLEYCDFTFDLMIFNRWGNKVFEAKDYQNNWGGIAPTNALGTAGNLPTGTYYYIINPIKNTNGEVIEAVNGYIYIGTN
ncbi:gliding motility-associated C-terminal domain-containing protein, partial [Maribacter chungangensis]